MLRRKKKWDAIIPFLFFWKVDIYEGTTGKAETGGRGRTC